MARSDRSNNSLNTSTKFKYLPLSIRLETVGEIATPLVLRGTPLPAKRSEEFSTAADNQKSVDISLWFGESPLTRNNVKLGVFNLTGIPPSKAGEPRIRVEFSVDETCAVVATARLEGSDVAISQTFSPPPELSESYVRDALADAEESREDDEADLRHIEAVQRANRLIRRAEEQLATVTDVRLNSAIAELGLALASNNAQLIREKADSVEQALASRAAPASAFGDLFQQFFTSPQPRPKPPNTASKASAGSVRNQGLAIPRSAHELGKIFGGTSFTLDPQLCFVLMPFIDQLQPLYEDNIRPTIERAGLRCLRADDVHGTNLITHDIWEHINRARILVAELTGRNPNVFYELGLAHALSKEVILITQSMDHVPFDLKALRCVCYEFTPRGVEKLEKALSATIDVLLKAK